MAKERITRRLKVYTTRIGIHDWAVAVPSQKAALQAWDVRENLFATGAAKIVDDPAVVEQAMKTPGVPVALRGQRLEIPEAKSNVVHLHERRALKPTPQAKKPERIERRAETKKSERKPAPPPPSPDRSRLDAAEDELREFEIEVKVRRKELARRKQELERETEAFETDADTRRRRLERYVEKARDAYERAKSG
jgi:hypothetical protein